MEIDVGRNYGQRPPIMNTQKAITCLEKRIEQFDLDITTVFKCEDAVLYGFKNTTVDELDILTSDELDENAKIMQRNDELFVLVQ